MCVILIARHERPSPAVVQACFEQNRDGAGIAWRDPDRPNEKVHWAKGIMKLDDIQELVAKVPTPFIAHFRIQTVGGTSRGLTHPFVMDEDSPLDLQGETDRPLIFHNGTWGEWRRVMFEVSAKAALKIPTGRWSDSRAMAWLAAYHGMGLFDLIQEKVALISPKHLLVFGETWTTVPGVGFASNSAWLSKMPKGKLFIAGREPETEEAQPQTNNPLECGHCGRMSCAGGCWEERQAADPRLTVVTDTKLSRRIAEAMNEAITDDGGASDEIPFEAKDFNPKKHPFWIACELYGRGELSKNKFKKSFHFHTIRMRKAQSSSVTLH
jgi:hypothetical protein